MSRPARLAVGLLVVLTAGCGGLRPDSEVREGLSVAGRPRAPVLVIPLGPQQDASPEQVVRGFLRAGAGVEDNDHAVARDYFMRAARQRWHADAGVWVYPEEAALTFTGGDPGRLDVTAKVVASIDSSGRYRQLPPGTVRRATFQLGQELGQWRIAELPDDFGLWLSSADVERDYAPYDIGYVSRASPPLLVPDVRWFPVSSALATTLARAQLEDVPGYLRGVVGTGVPPGTRLDPNAVPVVAGAAQVSLSAAALSATAEQRRALAAQFLSTLLQVPEVTTVAISAGGTALDLGGERAVSSLQQLGYAVVPGTGAPAVVLRQGGTLTWQDRSGLQRTDRPTRNSGSLGAELPTVSLGWSQLAVSRDGVDVAAVSGDGRELARWRDGESWRVHGFATELNRPAYDGEGGLWVAGRAEDQTRVFVLPTTGDLRKAAPRAVAAPWLAQRRVVALRVARDDLRAAVLSTNEAGGDLQLGIAGIVRDRERRAQSLTEPLRIGQILTMATDLVWADPSTLAVIARAAPTESLRPYLVAIGGTTTALAPVKGARHVTTTGGVRGLVVRSDAGAFSIRVGSGWQALGVADGVTLPGD